jgi:hypothetical protein
VQAEGISHKVPKKVTGQEHEKEARPAKKKVTSKFNERERRSERASKQAMFLLSTHVPPF